MRFFKLEGLTIKKKINKNKKRKEDMYIDFLVELLQLGTYDVFDALEVQLEKLTNSVIKNYFFPDYQYEDFKQESHKILFKALKNYDRSYGMKFPAYYQASLRNYLNNLVRKRGALKRKGDLYLVSLDHLTKTYGEHLLGTSSANSKPEDAFLVHENFEEYLLILSAHEKKCLQYYANGYSYEDIANKLSCDVSQVKSALYRCEKKYLDF